MEPFKLFSRSLACALAFLAMAGPSQAIVYTVNHTVGVGGVTGFVSTDDTLGPLPTASITDFNLVLDDGNGNMVNLLGPLQAGANADVTGLSRQFTATATDLLFDFSGPNGAIFFTTFPLISEEGFWCVSTNSVACGAGTGEHLQVGEFPLNHQFTALSGNLSIASVAVQIPQPGTLAILGLGLVGLGIARRTATLQSTATSHREGYHQNHCGFLLVGRLYSPSPSFSY